jgi:hypothetical protein
MQLTIVDLIALIIHQGKVVTGIAEQVMLGNAERIRDPKAALTEATIKLNELVDAFNKSMDALVEKNKAGEATPAQNGAQAN